MADIRNILSLERSQRAAVSSGAGEAQGKGYRLHAPLEQDQQDQQAGRTETASDSRRRKVADRLARVPFLRGLADIVRPGADPFADAPLLKNEGGYASFADISGQQDLTGDPVRSESVPTEMDVLGIHHLGKSYRGRRVIEDVSLYLRRGEVVGLLGPNGAGKTTLFYMITGLIRPDAGLIELDGHDVTNLPMYRRARLGVGYLPQEASIFRGLSVEDNIRAVLEISQPDPQKRADELEALLDEFDIRRLRAVNSLALSGGERRRCEIARALAGHPSFMLLDEPFAGIDPIAVADIQNLVRHLKNRGIGVLITDHSVRETLGMTDRAYIVHAGRILTEGPPEAIVADPNVRRFYLGDDFRM